ncbi:type IV pilin N-terminal domain-containing protein [Methanofollis formosanus]|nr:type IV pilin N-terminal domain-containing protein [Methanofollis formosanus]
MMAKDESAVSPVVGVMLMLVVTVIIAAVVSAFAGGMAETQSKTPQVTLNAKYAQSEGLTLYHEGGDTLGIGEFKLLLHPSSNYGSIEEQTYVDEIDPFLIENGQGEMWYRDSGGRQISRFGPGDIAYISVENCSTEKLTPDLGYKPSPRAPYINYGINNSKYIGSSFFLEMVTLDGKMIAKVEVPVRA